MNERIYLSSPHMGGGELEYVQEAFAANWVAPVGPHLTAFEQGLSDYLHGHAVAALSSGTAAIHLALIILGVKQNDEVLCASFTFSGSCNPIAYLGATPIFVDSEPETWNMDPALLEEAIQDRMRKTGKKPKTIIVVHLYGMPAKMDEIMAIARRHEIPVIEDAAEALGSLYKGQKCGTIGDFGILSFNGNKIITTSGGGALVSKNNEWIGKARFLATQARDPAPHYQHSEIGYNYRLSNVCAGIGRGQLEVLEQRVQRRREIYDFYSTHLMKREINFQPEQEGSYANRWLTCVLWKKAGVNEKIRLALEKYNIETRPLWKPMHQQPVFAAAPVYESGFSASLFAKGLCLPSGSNLTEQNLDYILKRVSELTD